MNKSIIIAGVAVTAIIIGVILMWRDLSQVKSRTKDLIEQHNNMRSLLETMKPEGRDPEPYMEGYSFQGDQDEDRQDRQDDELPLMDARAEDQRAIPGGPGGPLSAAQQPKPDSIMKKSSTASKKKVQIKE
jgi:hypothetical protein